tara:strand:- start:668 stop:2434 length:1767 start_codon:yes stop_codon:yes gene_type:complete
MVYSHKTNLIWKSFFSLLIIFTIIITGIANFDLIEGRFVLFMDEGILFDGIKRMFNHDGIKQLFFLIIDGGDNRYGKLFWNINALIALIPQILFGEQGLIFTLRMSSVFFLTSSFIIFSITFTKNWFFRIITLVSLLNLPFTSYYMSMPKPEPLQLFFLSLFLYFYKYYNCNNSKVFWVLLGIAYGIKISILPLLLIVIFLDIFYKSKKNSVIELQSKMLAIFFYIGFGLVIAVPMLFVHFIISLFIYWILTKIVYKQFLYINYFLTFLIIILNPIISYFIYIYFHYKTGFYKWINATFLNIGHNADDSSISFWNWIYYFFHEWLSSSVIINICLITLSALLFFIALYIYSDKLKNSMFDIYCSLLLILGSNITLCLIFLGTNRLYGVYIFPFFLLILIGLISLSEKFILDLNLEITNKFIPKLSSITFLCLLIVIVCFYWYPNNMDYYSKLANRTSTKEYKINMNSYFETIHFLEDYSTSLNKKINVIYDPVLFFPNSNNNFNIDLFWGIFDGWEQGYDIIIFSKHQKNNIMNNLGPNLINYKKRLSAKENYEKFIVNDNKVCEYNICYKIINVLENGSEILIKLKS